MHENAGHARMGGLCRSREDIDLVYGTHSYTDTDANQTLLNEICREIDEESLDCDRRKQLLQAMAGK